MKKLAGFLLIFVTASVVKGQVDPVYTQVNSAPITVNPATAGVFYGGFRLTNNYKSKWSTVGDPYVTMQTTFDKPVIDDIWINDFVAVGVTVTSDQMGASGFMNNGAMVMASYAKALDGRGHHFASVGFMGGAYQKSLSYEGLNWENQFDRTEFNQALPTGEPYIDIDGVTNQSFIHPDFGWGVHYVYNDGETKLLSGGVSMFHVTRPTYQFLGNEAQIYRRLNFHVDYKTKSRGSILAFWPKAFYSIQGPHSLLMVGSDFHWILQEAGNITGATKEITFSLGPYYRHKEGMMVQTRFQVGGLTIGLSYDFNLNQLRAASNNLGGPELLITYQSGYKKGRKEKHKHKRFEWRYD